MYAALKITTTRKDNTGDPNVDFDTDYEIILFNEEADATAFVMQIPIADDVRWALSVDLDTKNLTR